MTIQTSLSVRFIDSFGNDIAQPRDWQAATIVVDAPISEWESIHIWIQGNKKELALRRLNGKLVMAAEWPQSGPGHYGIDLDFGGQRASFQITVAPAKLSNDAYHELLVDLESRLPHAIALGLQTCGAFAGLVLPPPSASTLGQEVQRLRRAIEDTADRPGLITVLNLLSRDAHVTLTRVEHWTLAERARRPHPGGVIRALLRPGNLDATARPLKVHDARANPTVDTYENRLLLLFTSQVQTRLRRVLAVLGSAQSALLPEMTSLARDLDQARLAATFLDDVSTVQITPDRISMVLLKRPPYRAALVGFLEFHRSVTVQIDSWALDAPLNNLPYLYEVWGTLNVIDALLGCASRAGYRVSHQTLIGRKGNDLFLRLFPQQEALQLTRDDGTTIRCLPQARYTGTGGVQSFTFQQEPDVSIEVHRPNASAEILIFDPKYKLDGGEIDGRPTKTDIDKMHAYRDAIRNESGARVVSHAAILYPGPLKRWEGGIAAIRAYPGDADSLLVELSMSIANAIG